MILYMFASLMSYRNHLVEVSKECSGTSVELQSQIDKVEMEIIRHKEFYFGKLLKENAGGNLSYRRRELHFSP